MRIHTFEQDGNKSVSIDMTNDGTFTAMTYSQSKPFKRLAAAFKWMEKRGYTATDAEKAEVFQTKIINGELFTIDGNGKKQSAF